MYLHREGHSILIGLVAVLATIVFVVFYFVSNSIWGIATAILCFALFLLVAQFFRVPKRTLSALEGDVVCPSDGKVVVIEEVEETEYFKDKRIQVSIFMSPLNVHVQWTPIEGVVTYAKYHPGLFLVAWHPKSTTENERTTIVVKNNKHEVLFRQIAGAVARRIKYYVKAGEQVGQGEECGFIKFGSRVDIFLPLDSEIKVELGQKVTGMETILAKLP